MENKIIESYIKTVQISVLYSINHLKSPSQEYINSKHVNLQKAIKKNKKKTLFLDLDETLIHYVKNPDQSFQHKFIFQNDSGEKTIIKINIRPYVKYFFQKLNEIYEIFIFTASTFAYANVMMNYLDPKGKYIKGMLCRENCMLTKKGYYIKDLRIIANRDMKDMVIVDNLPHSFGFQISNGVPIMTWIDDENDCELKYLADYLIEASLEDDVRPFNEKNLKLRELAKEKF